MANKEQLTREFLRLVEIMKRLRSKDGCPWDRQQTYESLRQFLLEETYEVLELIDEGQYDELQYELGDLLLQVIFQSQIAEEESRFSLLDVLKNINEKLVYRHPNVFGDAEINSAEEQVVNWERLKKKENNDRSTIDGVPKTLPALLRAHRIQAKAATANFDWDRMEDVIGKVEEELSELKSAIKTEKKEEIENELGDLLFTIVNLSRFLAVNPEDALRKAIEKFCTRFRDVETAVKAQQKDMNNMSLEELDAIWNEVKKFEK